MSQINVDEVFPFTPGVTSVNVSGVPIDSPVASSIAIGNNAGGTSQGNNNVAFFACFFFL